VVEAQSRRDASYFPDVPVVLEDGTTVRFPDLLKGKLVVISFFYTNCPDLCPLTTARLARIKDELGDAVGRDVFFLSLSVDPAHDTPELVKAYAEAFDAGPGWHFVTGRPEDMTAITYKLGDRSQEQGLNGHRNEILITYEPSGEWARSSALGELDSVVTAIHDMDPTWRAQVHLPTAQATGDRAYMVSTARPGQALFTKLCAACHTVGGGDRVGPDLRGVTARREHDWLTTFIANPIKMLAKKDPAALELAQRFPGVRMPFLGLSPGDIADLIAYLDSETTRQSASARDGAATSQHRHD
jgi:protein SCO1/2